MADAKGMSTEGEQPQPGPGRSREVNLKKMAEQFVGGLQRHFDMLAFNLASREAVTEEAYDARSRAPRIMPATAAHQNFEQMQAFARDLLFRQVLNDSLNLAIGCLHNVHLFLVLAKTNKKHGGLPPEAQKEAQDKHQEFLRVRLDRKFNFLEEDFGVMCELEDTITSLGLAMEALSKQNGIVKSAQLDNQKELAIDLKVAAEGTERGDLWKMAPELKDQRKVFREGEKVTFSDGELQSVLLTIGAFGHQVFNAASRFAREQRGDD